MEENDKEEFMNALGVLKTNNLHLSAHTINSWQGQFSIMIRYYERALKAENQTDEFDFWITFFQNSYYLKDWLKEAVKGGLDKELKKRIESRINENDSMKICADICNGTKHLRINKNVRSDPYFAFFYEYAPFRREDEKTHNWTVHFQEAGNTKRYKLSDLALECIKFWQEFIKVEAESLK